MRDADQAGVDTVWVVDHLLQADPTAAPGETEMLEAYTTLGFLAGQAERVRLGTMVTGVTFRPPALLVKAVTTLDVLSAGRAWMGLGAGYQAEEAEVLARHCADLDRPYEQIEKTLSTRLEVGEPSDAFVARCAAAAALGIEHVVVITSGPWTTEALATLAAAIPALAAPGVRRRWATSTPGRARPRRRARG